MATTVYEMENCGDATILKKIASQSQEKNHLCRLSLIVGHDNPGTLPCILYTKSFKV